VLVSLKATAPEPGAKPASSGKAAADKKSNKAAPALSPEERAARVQQLKMRVLLVHRELQVAENSSKDDPLALWRSVAHDMATPSAQSETGSQTTAKNEGGGKSSKALREELEALKAELAALDQNAYADVIRSTEGIKTAEQRIKEHEHKIQEAPKISYPKVVFQDGAQQPKQKPKKQGSNLWKTAMSWIYRNEPVIDELEREIESI
jgi:ribosomal protein L29